MSDRTDSDVPTGALAGRAAPVRVIGLGLPVVGADPVASVHWDAAHPALAGADVLVGGKAQLAAFADHPAEKLLVEADAAALYERMEARRKAGLRQVVLCGGDPLFFGLGARLAERFGPEDMRILPGVSSLQAAASFLGLAWENVESVSLHGRASWLPLAHALIRARAGGGSVFVLTDAASSPAAVAAFMRERGYGRHVMHVLGNLHFAPDDPPAAASCRAEDAGGREEARALRVRAEHHARLSVEQASRLPPEAPAWGRLARLSLWIEPAPPDDPDAAWPFGLPDARLATEKAPLTRAPARAAGLAALGVEAGDTVWDLGAGSGAVSVEAARLAWRGQVIAVEGRAGRIPLLEENRRRFGAANLEIVHGLLPEALEGILALYPRPGRVFVGGGLGRGSGRGDRDKNTSAPDAAGAERLFRSAWEALLPGGRMAIHCVLLSTLEFVRAEFDRLGVTANVACIQASESVPLAGDIRLRAMNPVFLVSASKA